MSRDDERMEEKELMACLKDIWSDCSAGEKVGVLATLTDEEWGGTLAEFVELLGQEGRLTHLLELRAFEPARELHAVRDHLGACFAWRVAGECDDELASAGLVLDDVQYLDIDASPATQEVLAARDADERTYKSMSGGTYRLPVAGAERIRLRNYLEYDEDGLAHVVDFRIVELRGRGE